MHKITLENPYDIAAFRDAARGLLAAEVSPVKVMWIAGDEEGLFDALRLPRGEPVPVPAAFVPLAGDVICHSDSERLALLYQLLWRLTHGERTLLSVAADPLMHRLLAMQKAVRREIHKAHAFVRFRCVEGEDGEHYVAWFEPQHRILDRIAPFFTGRFPSMRWSILTPIGSLHWDGAALTHGPAVPKTEAPENDALEDWWRSYYRAAFNPSRANPRMMAAPLDAERASPEAGLGFGAATIRVEAR